MVISAAYAESIKGKISFGKENIVPTDESGKKLQKIVVPTKTYHKLLLSNCYSTTKIGEPQLPVKYMKFIIPAGTEIAKIKIISAKKKEIRGEYNIYPAQAPVPFSRPELFKFTAPKEEIYSSSQIYPAEIVESLGNEYLDGVNITAVGVYPVQYIPLKKKLVFNQEIEFQLILKASAKKPKIFGKEIKKKLRSWLEKTVSNPEDIDRYIDSYKDFLPEKGSKLAPGNYAYVIITNQLLEGDFHPLVDWKTKKGVRTKVVTREWIEVNYTGTDVPEKIRNFIIDAHSTWGTVWVLLGGDVSVIPTRITDPYVDSERPACDMYYACLDGNWNADGDANYGEPEDSVDMLAEVFVGRAPVEDAVEVGTFVNKVLTYEQTPPTTDYPLKACFVGCDDFGDAGGGE
ncbi:MAG: C25 family cysteine peptidase [Elusimicrobiota bacterium]